MSINNTGHEGATSPEAKVIHARAQRDNPRHDAVWCWWYCRDCAFDSATVWANDAAAGIASVVWHPTVTEFVGARLMAHCSRRAGLTANASSNHPIHGDRKSVV